MVPNNDQIYTLRLDKSFSRRINQKNKYIFNVFIMEKTHQNQFHLPSYFLLYEMIIQAGREEQFPPLVNAAAILFHLHHLTDHNAFHHPEKRCNPRMAILQEQIL